MAAHKGAVVMVLTKLVDSDDEREWIKRRRGIGYFKNIFQWLKVEDMFRMSVID